MPLETPEQLAAESGQPAHRGGPMPSVLVRCLCGAIHYATPGDLDPSGRLCVTCSVGRMPLHCQCRRTDCAECGPHAVWSRSAVRSW